MLTTTFLYSIASFFLPVSYANPFPIPQDSKLEDITGSTADSSISSSTDVWAMLVANIVPLLILLGEKHVKAYFKTMRHFTHYLIYAVGPIGLVTAVVTLIRILPDDFRALKRLIGRQYERRSEVLSDVSSVSCGAVETELKNGAFEQTIEPGDRSDVAICYLHGKTEGSAEDTFMAIANYWNEANHIYLRFISSITSNILPNLTGQFILSYSFRAAKVETARQLALYAYQAPHRSFLEKLLERHPEAEEALKNEEAYGLVSTFSAITGVSMGLTTVVNKDTYWRTGFRLTLSLAVIAANIVLIHENWKLQNDLQNTILISVGLFISTAGAYYTAYLVDSLSFEKSFEMKNIVKSGFYSQISNDWGRQLKEIPKEFVISCDAQATAKSKARLKARQQRHRLEGIGQRDLDSDRLVEGWKNPPKDEGASWLDYVTMVVALLMVVGYVALYVGLRTAHYWIALAIFASSMATSLARAFLLPDMMKLEKEELDHKRLTPAFPFSYKAEKNTETGEIETFFWDRKESTFEEIIASEKLMGSETPPHWRTWRAEDLQGLTRIKASVYEVVGAQKGSPIAFDSSLSDLTSNLTQFRRNEHLHSALRLTIELRKRCLVPAELVHFSKASEITKFIRYPSTGSMGVPFGLICPAFSDILFEYSRANGQDHVHLMRQPLEVLINTCSQSAEHWGFATNVKALNNDAESLNVDSWGITMWDFIITYQSWFYRADAAFYDREKRAESRILSHMEDDDFSILSVFASDRSKQIQRGLSSYQCLWMATKIAYLSFRSWPLEKLQSYYESIPVPNGAKLAPEKHVESMLKLAENTRTYLNVRSVLTPDKEGFYDKAMDHAISVQRWLDCRNAKQVAEVPCPFEDISFDLTGMMFE